MARKGTDTSSLGARLACVSPFFAQLSAYLESENTLNAYDEDAVITEHYADYADYYNEEILDRLAKPTYDSGVRSLPEHSRVRVDLNEYAKAEVGQRLETFGVATCTAVAVM